MFYMIIMGILSLCVAIFAVQNAVSVEVSFLFWHFSMSLALIIIGSLLIGLVLSGLIALKSKGRSLHEGTPPQRADQGP